MTATTLDGSYLLTRFRDLLKTHTQVDIATAWTTGGDHLQALADAASRERDGVKVRALVGIAGNATRPYALEKLREITVGDLRIVPEGDRLFHPKLYLFGRKRNGIVTHMAWIGSANFTKAGFGGYSKANEEIMLELGPGEHVDALALWFHDRWNQCPTEPPISEVIRKYTDDWKRNPPNRSVQISVMGSVSHRRDLLDKEHCPQTIEGYRQALEECEDFWKGKEGWEVFNTQGRSYMRVIARRQALLLGNTRWSELDSDSLNQFKGSVHGTETDWWGLMGRLGRNHLREMHQHETQIRASLESVVNAHETEFPDVAVAAMQEVTAIRHVGHGTATLLLALARPDRLLSLNGASAKGLGTLSALSHSTLHRPGNYRALLQWLYDQPWYADGPPKDASLAQVWRFRAALVDAFVYERA